MNAMINKEEIALLLPNSLTLGVGAEEAARNAALRGREESRPGLLARAITWLREMPRRRAVLDELNTLSDRELADIGLARGDIAHVFDADFALNHDRAGSPRPLAGRTVAA